MVNQGLLEVNFNIKNNIDLKNAFSSENVKNPLLKSISGNISAKDANSLENLAGGNTALQHIDTIRTNSNNTSLKEALNNLPNLKYVRLEGSYESKGNSFDNNTNLQKVDLSESLQIKPEDFKANENLKTLPNLDYSNPDLTDIITNDTNLLPTTFDISNEPNTTKLGIHGDSTHQLGNLEFVKVNPEAPFDDQIIPQIDVSYTSLNQNGLVNLFNTIPYNVGYQVVGNPTIEDSVASNFNYFDYISIPFNIDIGTADFEMKTLLLTYSGAVNQACICANDSSTLGTGIYWSVAVNAQVRAIIDGVSYAINTNTIPGNREWYVILYRKGTTLGVKWSSNNIDFSEKTITVPLGNLTIGNKELAVGVRAASKDRRLNGYINLKETYIKVGNDIVFNGQQYQTKAIDITGCVGTSSLSDNDKSIVTNKGWNLLTNGSVEDPNYTIENGKLIYANPNIYLDNTNNINAFIPTDIPGSFFNGKTIIAHVGYYRTSDNCPFGLVDTGAQIEQGLGWWGSSFSARFGDVAVRVKENSVLRKKIEVIYTPLTGTVNGVSTLDPREIVSGSIENWGIFSSESTMTLFLLASHRSTFRAFGGRFYDFIILQNDVELYHFVPVPKGLRIGNFIVPYNSLFDIVNQRFYFKAGNGDIEYGVDE